MLPSTLITLWIACFIIFLVRLSTSYSCYLRYLEMFLLLSWHLVPSLLITISVNNICSLNYRGISHTLSSSKSMEKNSSQSSLKLNNLLSFSGHQLYAYLVKAMNFASYWATILVPCTNSIKL